jgi:hypothetical protein
MKSFYLSLVLSLLISPLANAFTGDLQCFNQIQQKAAFDIFVPANADHSITLSHQILAGAQVQFPPDGVMRLYFGTSTIPHQFAYGDPNHQWFQPKLSAKLDLIYGIYNLSSGVFTLSGSALQLKVIPLKQVTLTAHSPTVANAAQVIIYNAGGSSTQYSCTFSYPWE